MFILSKDKLLMLRFKSGSVIKRKDEDVGNITVNDILFGTYSPYRRAVEIYTEMIENRDRQNYIFELPIS